MNTKLILTCTLGLALLACESTTSSAISSSQAKENALVGKSWQPTSDVFEPGIEISGRLISDNMELRQECDHDGTTLFASDGTYSADEGPTKCDESAPQVVTGTWSFDEKLTQIIMTPEGEDSQTYNIEALTDTSFKISRAASYWDESKEYRQIFGFSNK